MQVPRDCRSSVLLLLPVQYSRKGGQGVQYSAALLTSRREEVRSLRAAQEVDSTLNVRLCFQVR